MSKKEQQNQLNQKDLLALMQDSFAFEELSKWTNKINIFNVLKVSKTEIRHSNMLGWLLDPNENHGLEDSFLYGILSRLSVDLENQQAVDLLSSDLNTFRVLREWEHIDLVLVSQECKTIIAIENKIGSKEHNAGQGGKSQTKAYKERVEKAYNKNSYNHIFVYLTPDGDAPEDDEWLTLTYHDVVKILESVYSMKEGQLSFESKMLISNYIDVIKKDVTLDEKLVNKCNEIYKKHSNALDLISRNNKSKEKDSLCSAVYNKYHQVLDLIFDNREDKVSRLSQICREILNNHKERIEIDESKGKSYIKFWTSGLTGLFPNINKKYYFYQFEIRQDYIVIMLEYHKDKMEILDEKVIEAMKNAGEKFKQDWKEKNTASGPWNWYRIWTARKTNVNDEEGIRKWIKERIQELMNIDGTNK